MPNVPEVRFRALNGRGIRADGEYVLYWMVAFRRTRYNFALQRAAELSAELGKPLLILEALRCGHRWASDRLHRFILQGMYDNQVAFKDERVTYYPFVERKEGEGSGLLEAFSQRACVVVTDDFPCFFLPSMQAAAAIVLPLRLEAVDSNGLLPMRVADKVYSRAHDFRRFLQKNLQPHLEVMPTPNPLARRTFPDTVTIPREIRDRWPMASAAALRAEEGLLSQLPLDHDVRPASFNGGQRAAQRVSRRFVESRLERYADGRNDPDDDASSGLSPYLHFGHISAHEVFLSIARREEWAVDDVATKANGARDGWWGMNTAAEHFLDELVTWREVGFNMCWQRDDYDRYESLPEWARQTLSKHARDPRSYVYELETFAGAGTHDDVWNAAQTQLVRDGRMHNYLRMLWGKKILEWTESPEQAAEVMIELNNKFAVDGRNPNSYSGIFWVLGRYDRAWGPERKIFGKIRYMSSENTVKKLKMSCYLETYGGNGQCGAARH